MVDMLEALKRVMYTGDGYDWNDDADELYEAICTLYRHNVISTARFKAVAAFIASINMQ